MSPSRSGNMGALLVLKVTPNRKSRPEVREAVAAFMGIPCRGRMAHQDRDPIVSALPDSRACKNHQKDQGGIAPNQTQYIKEGRRNEQKRSRTRNPDGR